MSYEEIDKSVYGADVFTNGAKGRYAKAEPVGELLTKTGEKKKRAPKIGDELVENGHTEEAVKAKKKSRKVHETGVTQDEIENSQSMPAAADGEAAVKPKKKRAPKAESNIENIDPIPTTETEPVKKKKSKAPKVPTTEEDFQMNDNSSINQLDPTTEMTPKVKKPKKRKTPKTTDTADGTQDYANEYAYSGIYLFI
ncbi:hypothetical protein I4U23_029361 [Adineta vaga]|nr:hypothetical protein I4U23_029361 [Adineta vaga]